MLLLEVALDPAADRRRADAREGGRPDRCRPRASSCVRAVSEALSQWRTGRRMLGNVLGRPRLRAKNSSTMRFAAIWREWIAPRRSLVRVRLAPSQKRPAKCVPSSSIEAMRISCVSLRKASFLAETGRNSGVFAGFKPKPNLDAVGRNARKVGAGCAGFRFVLARSLPPVPSYSTRRHGRRSRTACGLEARPGSCRARPRGFLESPLPSPHTRQNQASRASAVPRSSRAPRPLRCAPVPKRSPCRAQP